MSKKLSIHYTQEFFSLSITDEGRNLESGWLRDYLVLYFLHNFQPNVNVFGIYFKKILIY